MLNRSLCWSSIATLSIVILFTSSRSLLVQKKRIAVPLVTWTRLALTLCEFYLSCSIHKILGSLQCVSDAGIVSLFILKIRGWNGRLHDKVFFLNNPWPCVELMRYGEATNKCISLRMATCVAETCRSRTMFIIWDTRKFLYTFVGFTTISKWSALFESVLQWRHLLKTNLQHISKHQRLSVCT